MEYSVNEGLELLMREIPSLKKPIFIAVHAPGPHHGKTYFSRELLNKAYENNKILLDLQTHSLLFDHSDMQRIKDKNGCIYEVGAEFHPVHPKLMDKALNNLAGKNINYHIFIYNPAMPNNVINEYGLKEINKTVDIIIENSESWDKNIQK